MKSTDKEILEMIEEWESTKKKEKTVTHEHALAILSINKIKTKLKAKPQPKCKYEKVAFNCISELLNNQWQPIGDLLFQWGESNVVPLSDVTPDVLANNPHKVVRKVEVDPVEELAKKLLTAESSVRVSLNDWEHTLDIAQDGYKAMAQYVIDNKEEL